MDVYVVSIIYFLYFFALKVLRRVLGCIVQHEFNLNSMLTLF
jgi:hypothetical protein